MSKVVGRLPRSLIDVATDPVHQIEELAVSELGVDDNLDLEFRDTVYVEGQKESHDAAKEWVWNMGLHVRTTLVCAPNL